MQDYALGLFAIASLTLGGVGVLIMRAFSRAFDRKYGTGK